MDRQIMQVLEEASRYFADAQDRDKDNLRNAEQVARAHRDGYQLIARAIEQGFRQVAQAVRDTGR